MKSHEGGMTRGALWVVAAILVVLIVLLVVLKRPAAPLPPRGDKPAVVRVMTLEPRSVPDLLRLTGRVQALRDALLSVEQEGVIVELTVDRGSRVRAGDLLLRADTRTWQAAADQAAVVAADAARDLRRWSGLRETGAVSETEYEAVRSRSLLADAALADARARLQQCDVIAPFDGMIDDRWVERGEFAGRGKAALRLVDTSSVKLRFHVPERDVLCVRNGDAVAFSIAAWRDLSFTGRVSFVSKTADAASNAFAAELTVDNADGRLRPGMIAEVELVRRMLSDALLAPLAAVLPHKGEHVVFLAEKAADGVERAVRRVVQMDAPRGHEVVLSRGVAPGDRLVVEGQRELRDGMPLDVRGPASSEDR
jgi:membrane fusion protein (multidrug efflux system)